MKRKGKVVETNVNPPLKSQREREKVRKANNKQTNIETSKPLQTSFCQSNVTSWSTVPKLQQFAKIVPLLWR